mmetsp:Transcript_115416/g.182415  ORF Transcript_115416/g.182415 Transcript_115416/m.182415 type:complete len:80 (+) Transcript_115416:748-987(+)
MLAEVSRCYSFTVDLAALTLLQGFHMSCLLYFLMKHAKSQSRGTEESNFIARSVDRRYLGPITPRKCTALFKRLPTTRQ